VRVLIVMALALALGGCSVVARAEILVCDGHSGIKSYHAHGSQLEVTCGDGQIYNIDWI